MYQFRDIGVPVPDNTTPGAPIARVRIQESLRFGNRFVIWNLQEITPAASLDVIHDFDEQGRLAPGTRTTLGLDFTVGWVF